MKECNGKTERGILECKWRRASLTLHLSSSYIHFMDSNMDLQASSYEMIKWQKNNDIEYKWGIYVHLVVKYTCLGFSLHPKNPLLFFGKNCIGNAHTAKFCWVFTLQFSGLIIIHFPSIFFLVSSLSLFSNHQESKTKQTL